MRSTSRRTSCARSAPRSRCRPTAPASCGGWGSASEVEAVSVVPSALVIRRGITGEVIADHPMGRRYEETFGAPYYGVHRVALLQALAERLEGEGVHLAHRCVGVEETAAGVELRFAGGSTATADVVVGADGVHSVIRPHVAGDVRGRYSGTVGYRGLVPVEQMPSLPDPDAAAVLGGTGPASAALRDRWRPHGQLPRGRPRPTMDERRLDGGVRGGRRRRRVRRLASRRHRNGRRDACRRALGAARSRAARALAHRSRRADGRRRARHGAPSGPGRQPDDRGRDRPGRLPGRGGAAGLAARPTRSAGAGGRRGSSGGRCAWPT